MSCCCGISLRGAAFFCTSVQIFSGLYFFLKWGVIPFLTGAHLHYFEDTRQRFLYPVLLIYLALFILLGIINFLALEKGSVSVLRGTTRIFLFIQVVELICHLILGYIFPDPEADPELHGLYHVQFILLNGLGSIIYFGVLNVYIRSLTNAAYTIEDDYSDYDSDPVANKKHQAKSTRKANKKRMKRTSIEGHTSASAPFSVNRSGTGQDSLGTNV